METLGRSAVEGYLAALPPDRRAALEQVRDALAPHLHPELEEGLQYGMWSWFVPHARYAFGYHCDPAQPLPYLHLASQKSHLAVYLFGIYLDPELAAWLRASAQAQGFTLDMGKSCLRFKRVEQLPLGLIGQALDQLPVDRFLERYEAGLPAAVLRKRRALTKG
jgi:hypothetical protein